VAEASLRSRVYRETNDAEGEAAETQVHLEFAFHNTSRNEFVSVDDAYETIIGQLVKMIDDPGKWLIKSSRRRV
jgi:hypothetical protein